MYIKVVKSKGFKRTSITYSAPHITVDQRDDGKWVIQFPTVESNIIITITMPDDADTVYQMNEDGDTVDSWSWDPQKEVAERATHDRPKRNQAV